MLAACLGVPIIVSICLHLIDSSSKDMATQSSEQFVYGLYGSWACIWATSLTWKLCCCIFTAFVTKELELACVCSCCNLTSDVPYRIWFEPLRLSARFWPNKVIRQRPQLQENAGIGEGKCRASVGNITNNKRATEICNITEDRQ